MSDSKLKDALSGYRSGGGGMHAPPEDPEAWTGGLFFALVLLFVMGTGLFGNGLGYSKITEPVVNFVVHSGRVLSSLGVKVGKTFGTATEGPVGQILPFVTAAGVVYVSSGRSVNLPSSDVLMGLSDASGNTGDPNPTNLGKAWGKSKQDKDGEMEFETEPSTAVDRKYTTESQKCDPRTLQNDTDPTGGAIGVNMECDSKDFMGSWWRVRLTKKNMNGSFKAEVVEGNGAIWDEVWPGNCRPAVANYPSFEIQQRDLPVFKPDDWDVSYFPPQELAMKEDYPGKVFTDAILLNEELPDPTGRNESIAKANIDRNYDVKWTGKQLAYFWPTIDLPTRLVNELQKKKR